MCEVFMCKPELKRSVTTLPDAMVFKPLHEKCPRCGFDLNEAPDTFVDEVKAKQAKNGSGQVKSSFKTRAEKFLTHCVFNNRVTRMIFPFAKTEKNATKRDE